MKTDKIKNKFPFEVKATSLITCNNTNIISIEIENEAKIGKNTTNNVNEEKTKISYKNRAIISKNITLFQNSNPKSVERTFSVQTVLARLARKAMHPPALRGRRQTFADFVGKFRHSRGDN